MAKARSPAPLSGKPWEPMKGEGSKAFTAFTIYRDLGPTRSLAEAGRQYARIMGREKASDGQIAEWSGRWRWVDRSMAWDSSLVEVKAKGEIREVRRQATRLQRERERRTEENLLCASRLKEKALQMVDWPLERSIRETRTTDPDGKTVVVQKTIEPNKWGMRDAAIMMRIALELEKLELAPSKSNAVDASDETVEAAENRIAEFRQRMVGQIENFPLVPPGSLTNPVDVTPEPEETTKDE